MVASKQEPVQSKSLDISEQKSLLLTCRAEARALKEPPGRSNPSCFQLDFLQEQKIATAGTGWMGQVWEEASAGYSHAPNTCIWCPLAPVTPPSHPKAPTSSITCPSVLRAQGTDAHWWAPALWLCAISIQPFTIFPRRALLLHASEERDKNPGPWSRCTPLRHLTAG